jgi:transcriptional regulator with XRE-family HTH domain
MELIGERLRSERVRLGKSQDDFAVLGGVQRRSQGSYERGERYPDAQYLAAIAKEGADIFYVVTGARTLSEHDLNNELRLMGDAWVKLEQWLSQRKRVLPIEKKRIAAEAIYKLLKQDTDVEVIAESVLQLAA